MNYVVAHAANFIHAAADVFSVTQRNSAHHGGLMHPAASSVKSGDNAQGGDHCRAGLIVAAFDFDGTFTRYDTMLPFLRFVSGQREFIGGMYQSIPTLLAYAIGRTGNQEAKENVLSYFLSGKSRSDLFRLGREFADNRLPRMISAEALRRLHWHQQKGHHCVLVSASLDLYLEHWAGTMKFDDVLCSSLATNVDGTVSGKLNGLNCYGSEKVRRLYQRIPETSIFELFAYGDSKGDRELLGIAHHAFFRTFPE